MNSVSTSTQDKEKIAQFIWTGFILAFFLIQAIIWTVAITLTAGDKSHAVVANYDQRALNWDEEVALRSASAKLGWKTRLLVDSSADVRGIHVITLEIVDRDSQPVSSASIELTAFHRSRAGDPQGIQLTEVGDGVYSGKIRIGKSGLWQFNGLATRENDKLIINERQSLIASK